MGCKECAYAPKTYEEYCIAKSNPKRYCPDAYTVKALYCGNYDNKIIYSDTDKDYYSKEV